MASEFNVSLPTLTKFLMIYSLACGSFAVFVWTVVRTLLCSIFLITAIPEVWTKGNKSFENYPLARNVTDDNEGSETALYSIYIILLVVEVVLFVYALYNLGTGLIFKSSKPISQYLVYRFIAWIIELIIVFTLALLHPKLIGWYLIHLMITILEFYGFVVVYSYYRQLSEDEITRRCKHIDELFEGRRFDCPYCNNT